MAHITRAGGPSNWREAFLSHPGLAVTPENHDLLLPARPGPAPVPEPEPEPAPAAAPEPPKAARARGSLA